MSYFLHRAHTRLFPQYASLGYDPKKNTTCLSCSTLVKTDKPNIQIIVVGVGPNATHH